MGALSLIEQELRGLQKELEVLSQLNKKRAQLPLDEIEVTGATLPLTSLYNGMERILKQTLLGRRESSSEGQSTQYPTPPPHSFTGPFQHSTMAQDSGSDSLLR